MSKNILCILGEQFFWFHKFYY